MASWAALGLCIAGTALMSLAPFVDPGTPIMANYIPVLDGRLFLAGLVVFAAGLRGAGAALPVGRRCRSGAALDGAGALRFGLHASVVSAAVALLAFGWSLAVVPRTLEHAPTTRSCSGAAAMRCSSSGRC